MNCKIVADFSPKKVSRVDQYIWCDFCPWVQAISCIYSNLQSFDVGDNFAKKIGGKKVHKSGYTAAVLQHKFRKKKLFWGEIGC